MYQANTRVAAISAPMIDKVTVTTTHVLRRRGCAGA